MKETVILSGKGGTGKTSITAALASLESSLILCDADVDAPDLHLLSSPQILESHEFETSWGVEIDAGSCTNCGICVDYCSFDAISTGNGGTLTVDLFRCEGCRLCERLCPNGAITSFRNKNSNWYISETRFGPMVHAKMGAGEENSGKLVTRVREKAHELASSKNIGHILTDGPPGTGCPVIAAMTGSDRILLVTEPTQSGLHDAMRVIELASGFNIPVLVLINKGDLHPGMSRNIKEFLYENKIDLLGELPFSEDFTHAMSKGQNIMEYDGNGKLKERLLEISSRLFHDP